MPEPKLCWGKLFKSGQGCFTTELTPSWKPFSIKLCHSTAHILFHWWGVLGHFLISKNRHGRLGEKTFTVGRAGILTVLKFSLRCFSLTALDFTCKISKCTLKCEDVKTSIKPWYVFSLLLKRNMMVKKIQTLSILEHGASTAFEIWPTGIHILVQQLNHVTKQANMPF